MKKFCFLLIAAIMSANVFAANEDEKIDVKLPIIKNLEVNGEIAVNLVYGDEDRVEGVIPFNQKDNFSWKIVNGKTLEIKLKKPLNIDGREVVSPIKLTIYVSGLDNIKCKNRASIIADKPIKGGMFEIEAHGNTVVSLPVDCHNLKIDASMSSIVNIKGKVKNMELRTSYAALFNAKELDAESVTVNALTDSECYVKASKVLVLNAKLKGHIFYFKNDAVVSQRISTLGEISEYK